MSKKFWIKKVRIHRTPGFPVGAFPPVEDLSEGLNVIWGPNGVGKSSLSRSLCALLWKRNDTKEMEAEGTLETPEGQWELKLSQGILNQTRLSDNQTIPLLGRSDDLSDSYWFPLHDLLQSGETGTAFAKLVKKEMQGGVDLQKAFEQTGGKKNSWTTSASRETKNLHEAERNLRDIQGNQEKFKGISEEIKDLENAIKAGAKAKTEKLELEQAKAILELHETIAELEGKMETYPDQVSKVDEKSPERLQELKDLLFEKEKALALAQNGLENLRSDYRSCAITQAQFDDISLSEKIQDSLDNWDEAMKQVDSDQKEYDRQAAALKTWEEQHAWIMDKAPEKQTLQDKVATLKKLASQCEPLRCEVVARQDYLSSLGERELETDDDSILASLSVRLGDWMQSYTEFQATPEGVVVPENLKKKVILTGFLGALVMGLLALIHPLATLIGAFVWVFLLLHMVPNAQNNAEKVEKAENLATLQKTLEEQLARLTGFGVPEWNVASCLALQANLAKRQQDNQSKKVRNQARKVAEEKLGQSQKKLTDWQAQWQSACTDVGLSSDNLGLSGAEFFHFSEQLKKWVDLVAGESSSLASLDAAKVGYQKALEQLQRVLDTQQTEVPYVRGEAKSLAKRINRAHELQQSIVNQVSQVKELQDSVQKQQKSYREFWEKLEIEFDDERTLEEIAAVVPKWKETKQDLKFYGNQKTALVEKFPQAANIASEKSLETIVSLIDSLTGELEGLEGKPEVLGSLKNQYASLLDGSELALAMRKKQEAQDALEMLRQQEVFSNVIGLLVEKLAAQAEMDCQPQVLVKASNWMKRITQGRYTLSVNDEGFFAHDTVQTGNYKLDELSSATRVQLLFAVRMAFIESQELSSGVHFPIFLDELLANSDDDRAMAIAQAIEEIAKDRQVFYFTAQRDEVEKLKSLNVVNFKEIPLEDLKRGYALDKTPRPVFTVSKPVFPAFDADYNRYGEQCKVAGPSLYEPIENLHSWYLLTSSEKLATLLKGGLTYIGQVIATIGEKQPELKQRYELLQKAQRLAQEGRCRQLTASDLEAEDLQLSRKAQYWQQIVDLVSVNKLSGKSLLEATDTRAVTRFSADNRQILSAWLYEHQFATDETPYTKEDILDKLYASDPEFTIDSEDRLVVQRWLDGVVG
jgi:uncharacterized protein YhaN